VTSFSIYWDNFCRSTSLRTGIQLGSFTSGLSFAGLIYDRRPVGNSMGAASVAILRYGFELCLVSAGERRKREQVAWNIAKGKMEGESSVSTRSHGSRCDAGGERAPRSKTSKRGRGKGSKPPIHHPPKPRGLSGAHHEGRLRLT
jgi:hypothetical protein